VIPEFANQAAFEHEMHAAFKDIADAILPFARRKYLDHSRLQTRRELIASKWDQIRSALSKVLIPAALSRAHLKAAGAIVRVEDLNISRKEMLFACRYGRWIRDRYTVLDLAAEIGVLEEWLDEIEL
jgi:glycerol-1-phosphate dehydrogenase [NAD(P)+]